MSFQTLYYAISELRANTGDRRPDIIPHTKAAASRRTPKRCGAERETGRRPALPRKGDSSESMQVVGQPPDEFFRMAAGRLADHDEKTRVKRFRLKEPRQGF